MHSMPLEESLPALPRLRRWEEAGRLGGRTEAGLYWWMFLLMFLHLEPETVPNLCDEHLAALKQLYTSASLPAERSATKGAFHGFCRSQQLLLSLCKHFDSTDLK